MADRTPLEIWESLSPAQRDMLRKAASFPKGDPREDVRSVGIVEMRSAGLVSASSEIYPINVDRMRCDDDAYCEGCDNGDDGPSASAVVAVSPTWNVKHTHLCRACIARLYAACDAFMRNEGMRA